MARELTSYQKRIYPQIVNNVLKEVDEHGNVRLALENTARAMNSTFEKIYYIYYRYRKHEFATRQ